MVKFSEINESRTKQQKKPMKVKNGEWRFKTTNAKCTRMHLSMSCLSIYEDMLFLFRLSLLTLINLPNFEENHTLKLDFIGK